MKEPTYPHTFACVFVPTVYLQLIIKLKGINGADIKFNGNKYLST